MSVEIIKAIADGRGPAALVTVIDVEGSAPRHAGSRMLVLPGAERHPSLGTVGGGKGEARAIEAALGAVRDQAARVLTLEFQGLEVEGQDMICGGTSRLLVEPVTDREPYRLAAGRLARGERVMMVKTLGPGGAVALAMTDERGEPLVGIVPPSVREAARRSLDTGMPAWKAEQDSFLDPLVPEEKLLILGGGYVGQAVAWHASRMDFRITVADDRADFSAAGRFPPGTETRTGSYAEIVRRFPFDSSTYVVMVTRGHLTDLECVREVVARPSRYAGFIGSARKAKLFREQLAADGVEPARVEALHAPIGMDVGAETPDELAIAILAEIVAVRRNVAARRAQK
ncbi:MAG TPA: XdhC family protein [Spirochaetia bacterium]|nr:XdhC family protein [Spirochaetia bacterium]